jgi:tRNA(adenine34) deaminase
VGAVLVGPKGAVLSRAHNAPISRSDPTAHAEILALRRGARALGNYRLEGAVLAVTLEPCLMCLGALVQARVAGLVYGAADPKAGAVASCLPGPGLPFLNHRFWAVGGVRAADCAALLQAFFRRRRAQGGPREDAGP